MCFHREGILFREFDQIFSDVFGKRAENYKTVVEIRRRKTIDLSVVDEVREKLLRLPGERSLSLRTALVYEGKLDPRVETEGYFDFLIPFARLLEGA